MYFVDFRRHTTSGTWAIAERPEWQLQSEVWEPVATVMRAVGVDDDTISLLSPQVTNADAGSRWQDNEFEVPGGVLTVEGQSGPFHQVPQRRANDKEVVL
jgi:hypothetical protein